MQNHWSKVAEQICSSCKQFKSACAGTDNCFKAAGTTKQGQFEDLTQSEISLLNIVEEFQDQEGPLPDEGLSVQDKQDAESLAEKGYFERVPGGYSFIRTAGLAVPKGVSSEDQWLWELATTRLGDNPSYGAAMNVFKTYKKRLDAGESPSTLLADVSVPFSMPQESLVAKKAQKFQSGEEVVIKWLDVGQWKIANGKFSIGDIVKGVDPQSGRTTIGEVVEVPEHSYYPDEVMIKDKFGMLYGYSPDKIYRYVGDKSKLQW